MIALAGGPGQAALPFAADVAQIMQSALGTRDLVVFDQRGTGDSGPLACSALSMRDRAGLDGDPRLREQVGATRGLYTTDDSASDIEQIRKALGYTKLVLYGTSYGTKVAQRYAALLSRRTSRGSCSTRRWCPTGPTSSTSPATRRCRACSRSSAPPAPATGSATRGRPRDGAAPSRQRLRSRPSYYNAQGVRVRVKISPQAIAQVLFTGDDDPVLRADFPAAIAAAAAHHYGLLAILVDHANAGATASFTQVNNPLFFDTECEELPFPWNRADPPAQRLDAGAGRRAGAARRSLRPVQRAHRGARRRVIRLCLLALRDGGAGAGDHLAAQRADADHQRRRRHAHPDRQRRRGRGDDPRRHASSSCPRPAIRC